MMRGGEIDPGIHDEAIEHASLPIMIFGTTCRAWGDIFRYWARPTVQYRSVVLMEQPLSSSQ